MIHLHRPEQDAFSDKIEQELEELVVARKIHWYTESPPDRHLPFIEENGTTISGREEIARYLKELGDELRQQRMITGDGCYIDPDTGKVC